MRQQAAEAGWVYADQVTEIDCFDDSITSLSGMESFRDLPDVRLTRLDLETRAQSLDPLIGLVSLEKVRIYGVPVDDIAPLSTLNGLVELEFSGVPVFEQGACPGWSPVEDLSPLGALTELRALRLGGCFDATDYSVISGLLSLEVLSLISNRTIQALPSLGALTELQSLNLLGSSVRDFSALSEVPWLLELYVVANGPFADGLTAVADLTALRTLEIYDYGATDDLALLAEMVDLETLVFEWLDLDNMPIADISDLSPLAGLERLRVLRLEHAQISDITPLAGLPALEELSLNDNQVSDISSLGNIETLVRIELNENRVVSVPDLQRLIALESLSIDRNRIVDISALALTGRLESLSLDYNKIVDLEPLRYLHTISFLSLDKNEFLDLDPLFEMQGLEQMSLLMNKFPCRERDRFMEARPEVEVAWGSRCL